MTACSTVTPRSSSTAVRNVPEIPRRNTKYTASSVPAVTRYAGTAWMCENMSQSRSLRGALASPACGPAPVTTTPSMTASHANTATAVMAGRRTPGRAASGEVRNWPVLPYARLTSRVANTTRAMDTRKCRPTTHGFSWVSTVMPPMMACAGMLASRPRASRNRSLRSLRRFHKYTSIRAATAASANVRRRLPNSMKPWMPISGVLTRELLVHLGQVGQPRPEAVSRTAPPVTTSTVCPIRDRTARRRTVESTVTGSLDARRPTNWGRREAVLTLISIPFEPADGCCAGENRPHQQDKDSVAVHGAVQERVPQAFAKGPGRQQVNGVLGEFRQPLHGDHNAAQGAEQDPQQVGDGQRCLGADGARHQQAQGGERGGAQDQQAQARQDRQDLPRDEAGPPQRCGGQEPQHAVAAVEAGGDALPGEGRGHGAERQDAGDGNVDPAIPDAVEQRRDRQSNQRQERQDHG